MDQWQVWFGRFTAYTRFEIGKWVADSSSRSVRMCYNTCHMCRTANKLMKQWNNVSCDVWVWHFLAARHGEVEQIVLTNECLVSFTSITSGLVASTFTRIVYILCCRLSVRRTVTSDLRMNNAFFGSAGYTHTIVFDPTQLRRNQLWQARVRSFSLPLNENKKIYCDMFDITVDENTHRFIWIDRRHRINTRSVHNSQKVDLICNTNFSTFDSIM